MIRRDLFLYLLSMIVLASSPQSSVGRSVNGDAVRGLVVYLDRESGHCTLCHQAAQIEQPFQGNIGPDLSTVGDRMSAEDLRNRIVNPQQTNPESVMPAYHFVGEQRQVAPSYAGQPVLTRTAVDDLVVLLLGFRASRDDIQTSEFRPPTAGGPES